MHLQSVKGGSGHRGGRRFGAHLGSRDEAHLQALWVVLPNYLQRCGICPILSQMLIVMICRGWVIDAYSSSLESCYKQT